jgi:hypothetical protein
VNKKVLLLNLALLALAGLLLWQLRLRRQQAEMHERAVLLKNAQARVVLAPPAPAPVPPVAPSEYIDSVQKMLFSKDRNPNVIVDPPPAPKPAPPPPPMPALPRYYGQIHFGGDPVVILSTATSSAQKSYAVGEKITVDDPACKNIEKEYPGICDFKLLAFDKDSITFEWNGQDVEKKLNDLKSKDAPPQQVAAAPPPPPAQQANAVTSIGGAASSANNPPPAVGNDMGGGLHACTNPDDGSPSGTVVGGYRKVINQGLMGKSCYWEQVK